MTDKKTVVLGASPNPQRYAYTATQLLRMHGHTVIPIGNRVGHIGNEKILTLPPTDIGEVDTVTLYLSPPRQEAYYDYILNTLQPKRIIFNPGTENAELIELAEQQGILCEIGCTLVMLSTQQY